MCTLQQLQIPPILSRHLCKKYSPTWQATLIFRSPKIRNTFISLSARWPQ